jgi:hypothetical protein
MRPPRFGQGQARGDLQTRGSAQRCERVRHRAFTHGVAADIAAALCKMAGREAAPGNRDEDETNQTIACGIDQG